MRAPLLYCAAVAVALLAASAEASRKEERRACEDIKRKIRVIEARMRAGYTASQGIRLEARLRKLKDERYKRCR